MAEDIALTRRRRMLAFLVEQGGSGTLADANAFSEAKLLAAHQAFSAIMEGIVDGGFVTWDGTTFVVTDAGRAEAALAPQPRRRKATAAAAEASAPAEAPAPAAKPAPAPAPAHDEASASAADPAGGHDHDHAHGGARDGSPLRGEGRPVGPRPEARPPGVGLRARMLGVLRGLLRGR